MRFSFHASSGPTGPSGSFFLFLAFALAAFRLVTAVSLGDGNRSPFRLLARDDPPYPDDYPYPKKADIPSSVTTEKDKSLFYTLLKPKGGATGQQLKDFRKSESLHIVGDTKFTIHRVLTSLKPSKTATVKLITRKVKITFAGSSMISAQSSQRKVPAKYSSFSLSASTARIQERSLAEQHGYAQNSTP